MLLFSPLLLVVIFAGVEDLSGFSGLVLLYLVGTGLFDYVISDYLWARAIILTTPTVATVGLSITIPLAFLGDILLHGYNRISAFAIVGSLLVMCGFGLVNASSSGAAKSAGEQEAVVEPSIPASAVVLGI